MLGKLLKYDAKEIGKALLPVYLIVLGLSAAVGFSYRFLTGTNAQAGTPLGVTIFLVILVIALGVVSAGMAVFTLVLIIRNFRENLFGNRGYLTNTLPVPTTMHVVDKTINGILWAWVGLGVGFLSWILLWLSYSSGTQLEVMTQRMLHEMGKMLNVYGKDVIPVMTKVVIMMVFTMMELVAMIFASISVGNLWKKHRKLGGLLAFVGFLILQILIASGLNRLPGNIASGTAFQVILNFIYTVLFSVISILTLRKKLNLE